MAIDEQCQIVVIAGDIQPDGARGCVCEPGDFAAPFVAAYRFFVEFDDKKVAILATDLAKFVTRLGIGTVFRAPFLRARLGTVLRKRPL
jgi:hypothetical protein